jgi:succinoglycan biosynthesis protein ExoM
MSTIEMSFSASHPHLATYRKSADPIVAPISTVEIAICTFRRDSVFATLDSIADQSNRAGIALSVIVADNDHEPLLADRLQAASNRIGIPIRYIHAPACNISIARNACLDVAQADALILIDDDELADRNWLRGLLDVAERSGADVVFGPARAVYPDSSPQWMKENDFHSNIPVASHGIVETGYCSNALLDLRIPQVRNARFDEAFGRTGGEDTDFFFRLHRAGVIMAISDNAVVREPVAQDRLSFRWLLRRRYAAGRIYGHCATNVGSDAAAYIKVAESLLKSAACGVLAVGSVFVPHRAAFWIMRSSFHYGVAAGAVQAPQREVYGSD